MLSIDVGTTIIKAFIYDQHGVIRGHDNEKVQWTKITFAIFVTM